MKFSHLALSATLLIFSACADDSPSNGNNIFVPDMGEKDVSVDVKIDTDMPDAEPDADVDMEVDMADMGPDVDLTCPAVPCDAGEVCVGGACLTDTSCGLAVDLGTLANGIAVNNSGTLVADGRDTLTTSCSGATSSRERVLKFTLAQPALVDFEANWTGQFDGVVSIRTTCDDETSEVLCQDNEFGSRLLEAGDYFVILEMKLGNPGTYDFTVTAESSNCSLGESVCMQDVLMTCPNGTDPEPISCPASCTSGACDGGSCATAITVTAPGGTYTADPGAFVNTLNFTANASCGNIATPGFEAVFYLPGLVAGDIVNIDAQSNDNNTNAIFVTTACGSTETCVTYYAIEDPDWVVTADGDYYIVVDKYLNSRAPFTYTINIF